MHADDPPPTAELFVGGDPDMDALQASGEVSEFAFRTEIASRTARGRRARNAAPSLMELVVAGSDAHAAAVLASPGVPSKVDLNDDALRRAGALAGRLLLGQRYGEYLTVVGTTLADTMRQVFAIRLDPDDLEPWTQIGDITYQDTPEGPTIQFKYASAAYDPADIDRLEHAVRASGLHLRYSGEVIPQRLNPTCLAKGVYNVLSANIEIQRGRPDENNGWILAHELGHALDPRHQLLNAEQRAVNEVVADLAATVVTVALTGELPKEVMHLALSVKEAQSQLVDDDDPDAIPRTIYSALSAAGCILTAMDAPLPPRATAVRQWAPDRSYHTTEGGAAQGVPAEVSRETLPYLMASLNCQSSHNLLAAEQIEVLRELKS